MKEHTELLKNSKINLKPLYKIRKCSHPPSLYQPVDYMSLNNIIYLG